MNYNSLHLVKQKNYVITTQILLFDIEEFLIHVPIEQEPAIPFPQADRISRVINLIELLYEKPMTKQEITTEYDFDKRQTDYYGAAGRYLGLIEKEASSANKVVYFKLTKLGNHIMKSAFKQRQLTIAGQILKHKVFS